MVKRLLAAIFLVFIASGCSFYDVAALSADAALLVLEGPKSKDERDRDDGEPVFWDAEVSQCIQSEKRSRTLESHLDAVFDAEEAGRDYVILPNGEKYPVGPLDPREEELQSPTAECLGIPSDR